MVYNLRFFKNRSSDCADWASSIDHTDTIVPKKPRPKPPSSIEHRAEPTATSRTTLNYPIIQPTPSPNGIKPNLSSLVKGLQSPQNPQFVSLNLVSDMLDPIKSLDSLRPPTPSTDLQAQQTRLQKFKSLLQMPIVPLSSLKKLAWNGIPDELRPLVWQILLGYLPCEASSRTSILQSKRREYKRGVEGAFKTEGGLDQAVWHQIRIDVPRTNPHLSLYQFEATQKVFPPFSRGDISLA